jgi:DNA-binding LacI/PurR family transcriptional regulator
MVLLMAARQTDLDPDGSRATERTDGLRSTLNIQAVADAAGVSKTTVSHVISGNRPVSAATRRRVERVMEEMGFRPNFFAQALKSQRSHAVALIVQDLTNPFYPALARGLQQSVAAQGQVVMLFDASAGAGLTHAFVETVVQRRVDGVVVAVSNVEDDLLDLRRAAVAVVAVGSALTGLPIDWVSADDSRIGADATRYLYQRGHRRIATISGPVNAEPGATRLAGYRAAMTQLGLDFDGTLQAEGDWTRDGGAAALGEVLRRGAPPTAVFCANDLMAIGAMDAAFAAGMDVPGDLAIVGVDDIDAAGLVRPALTTVRVPAEEIGRAAGELLLHRIDAGAADSHRHVLVQHTLIARDSA